MRVYHVRKRCTVFESCRMDIRAKNHSGRRSTRTDMEEMNLENRGVTNQSRRFHSDNKLEMAVREWWRMEHHNFYHDFPTPPPPQLMPKRDKCSMCSEVMFESNRTSMEQMICIEICNEFSFKFHDLGNPLNGELNPICHLLALLGTHHVLHISRIRVKHPSYILNSFISAILGFPVRQLYHIQKT
jgi:hypothetical protein